MKRQLYGWLDKKKKASGLLLIFTGAVICYACSSRGEGKKEEADNFVGMVADVVVLEGVAVENNIYSTGSLISDEFIELKAPVPGVIMDIFIREGEKVKEGQKLVQLDDREWQAQLLSFKAQLAVAEKNLERSSSLFEINGVSKEIFDQAEGNVASLKANIAEVKVKIDQAAVTAPFGGYIGLRNVSKGEFITTGTSMASLVQSDPIKLDFSLPGKYAFSLKPGQKIKFSLDGIRDTLDAAVYAIEPRLDATSRTVRVRAKADNSLGKLFPGAFVNVILTLDKIENAMVVPTEAVVPELNAQKVYIVKEGKALSKPVMLGIRSGKSVQIADGLMEGDTVLVTGLLQVQENMPVKIGTIVNQLNSRQ